MNFLHPQYEKMQQRWKDARDAADGEYEVHAAREEHLPRLNMEADDAYNLRLKMTPWFGATWRTIIALRGMIFRRPPDIKVTDVLKAYLTDVDNAGTSFISFSQKVSLDDLIVGRVGVLVDHTPVAEGATVADAQNVGARPYMCMYATENILNWGYSSAGGRRKLSFVRLQEDPAGYPEVELKDGEALHKVLVLEQGQYVQYLYHVSTASGKETIVEGWPRYPTRNTQPIPFIPFQPIGVDSLECKPEIPPLMDLITMNYHHYEQSSSYERGCFLSGLPTLFIYGDAGGEEGQNTVYLGGSKANVYPNPQTKAEFVEVQSSFEALLKNIEKKEFQMGVLGARMLEPRNAGVESGEAWKRKQAGDESVLVDMSTTLSEGMTNPLRWMAWWLGQEDEEETKVEFNKEFMPPNADSALLTSWMTMYIQGGMSWKTLFYNLDRAGMYPPGTKEEDEKGRIEEGTPGMGTLPTGGSSNGGSDTGTVSGQPDSGNGESSGQAGSGDSGSN